MNSDRKTGAETFHSAGRRQGFTVLEFWQWSSSDLVGNRLRGVLAEYLVGKALGCLDGCRTEWDACDLRTAQGLTLEVKASGYRQSWSQKRESSPTFSIRPARGWDSVTNTYVEVTTRMARIYVFALHAWREAEGLDPLSLDQWEFFVVPTSLLDSDCPGMKTIGLARVRKLSGEAVNFAGLQEAVARCGVGNGLPAR